jgi:subtilisin family serine protease
VGTAPKAEVVLIRSEVAQFEYIIEEYHWVAAAEFADSIGVDVCNTSLGYTTFDDERQNHTYSDLDGNSTVITRGANMAAETGMLIVNSAGNSGSSSWRYMGAPADGDLVLAVGAVDSNGVYVGFSSMGPNASGDVKPNVMAQGLNVATIGTNNELTRVPGTSFSSPIIAGAAACLWQANPNKTALEIKEMIEKSGHLYDNPNDLFGYGIPNFARADWPTGITEVEERVSYAYPNPASQTLNILKPTGTRIEIYAVTGELVLQELLNTSKLDISSLQQGIYVLNIDGIQQKLVIQR